MEVQIAPGSPTPDRSLEPKRSHEPAGTIPIPPDLEAVKNEDIDESDADDGHLTGLKLMLVLASVTLVVFLMLLDMSIIVTAIPRITSQFHSLPDVGWYGSAYQLASASLQPLTGKVYTYFSSKWTFLAFFAVFELGSLLCGVATSSKMLIVGRAVAGIGSSGLQNGALVILATIAPLSKRAVSQLGLVVGPLVGGALTEYTTWRWCFYINLPVGGLVAAALIIVRIPDQIVKINSNSISHTILKKLDLGGFALFAPAAIQFLLALQYGGNQYSWNSATVIGLFCGAGGTFTVFLAWEYYKAKDAMIPFHMVRQRECGPAAWLCYMTMCASYYLPIYFQAVRGVSPLTSGVYLLPSILSQMLFAVGSGILVGKLGYYLPASLFSGVVTAIGNGLLSILSPTTSTGRWIGYQIVVGSGRGSGMQMPILAVQRTVTPAQISIATSLVMFCSTLGGAVFLTLANTIFDNSLKSELPNYAPSVNATEVIAAGATGFRDVVTKSQLPGVLKAYGISVDRVFYLTAGAGFACFCFAWGMGWKDLRKKNNNTETKV
ncbi:putative MFS general substrate transporter [Lipomyces doorenjongii]